MQCFLFFMCVGGTSLLSVLTIAGIADALLTVLSSRIRDYDQYFIYIKKLCSAFKVTFSSFFLLFQIQHNCVLLIA